MDYEEQPNSQKYVEVHIYFPQTCKEPYKMSINDAKQSGYIATQITYFENDNFDYIEIVVPTLIIFLIFHCVAVRYQTKRASTSARSKSSTRPAGGPRDP